DYPYMINNEYNGSAEYEKTIRFLELGCNCGCSKMIPREKFAELREVFQALSRSEQDIFLMAQLKAMNGGEITASRQLFYTEIAIRLYVKKRISICWELAALTSKCQKPSSNEWHNTTRSCPGRNVNRITQSLTLLPAETSYKSVYRDFIAGLENDSTPRTDLCDTCQHFRNGLQYNPRKEEEAKDLLKKYKEHLVKAKLERNYYNKNTKLAEQQRKLVDDNYVVTGGKLSQVHLFGIQDEAVREQINYVLDEDEIIGKGLNGTLSLVVKRSSTAGLNKAQCYENGKGSQYLDLNSVLGIFFKKLSGLQKYQHFIFEVANPGVVKAQLVANVLTPALLDYKRQEYLYHKIRPFVRDEFKDITCPKPIQN
ncbi:1971_t:CDS:2, partial [Ambispora leptoticha]